VVSYRVMLDVPAELTWFVSGPLAARRREVGTRKLTCYQQALFGLAWYRDKPCISRLGAGFGLSQATAYRYIDEVTDVLAARAPGLREALQRALAGHPVRHPGRQAVPLRPLRATDRQRTGSPKSFEI
jgi:hypothetical protein